MGSKLRKLLDRPRYLPQPTREEIYAAALLELHLKLQPFVKPAGRLAQENTDAG